MTVTVDKLRSNATQTDTALDFESLFRVYWPRIYGVIFRIVGDQAEAEDLALEVFLKLHHKLDHPAKANVLSTSGWLYRVATNLGLNALRARKRRQRYELEAGKMLLEASPFENPAVQIERSEERQRVRNILARMKPRSSKILVLRHSGLSYAEIAVVVKVSPTSVGKLLSRAEKEFESLYHALEGS